MKREKTEMCNSMKNENKSTKVKNTRSNGEGFKSETNCATNCTNKTNPNTTSRG